MPQTRPPGQVPHWSVPPQPSEAAPQLNPSAAHVVGAQTQAPATHEYPVAHALPQKPQCAGSESSFVVWTSPRSEEAAAPTFTPGSAISF